MRNKRFKQDEEEGKIREDSERKRSRRKRDGADEILSKRKKGKEKKTGLEENRQEYVLIRKHLQEG